MEARRINEHNSLNLTDDGDGHGACDGDDLFETHFNLQAPGIGADAEHTKKPNELGVAERSATHLLLEQGYTRRPREASQNATRDWLQLTAKRSELRVTGARNSFPIG